MASYSWRDLRPTNDHMAFLIQAFSISVSFQWKPSFVLKLNKANAGMIFTVRLKLTQESNIRYPLYYRLIFLLGVIDLDFCPTYWHKNSGLDWSKDQKKSVYICKERRANSAYNHKNILPFSKNSSFFLTSNYDS